ncbi:MAG: 5-methyltetrahydropteroyltriglutamate--homocysteine S-methyltransferase [Alphaproteobacteria bacterium]|nr:5-methyltetrahydropteroyltriglutamate--homocysteine S-methyltransferase [Alphaproteobacteria bacterium]
MVKARNLGYPRVGAHRELKRAVEAYWKGESSVDALQATAKEIRKTNWQTQQNAGIDIIPSNDFSFYDHVLDTIALVGAVPARYQFKGGNVGLDTYFAMARGAQTQGADVTAMEMTKWFDTNYHYIVPEYSSSTAFAVSSTKIVDEYNEAKALGIQTVPTLVGPVTLLLLGKTHEAGFKPINLLAKLVPVYVQVLEQLKQAGAEWVQLDEPYLVMDGDDATRKAFTDAYKQIAAVAGLKVLVATYFDNLGDNLATAVSLPVAGLHIDCVRAPEQLDHVLAAFPADKILSVGVVDGRNIWKNNFDRSLALINKAIAKLGKERVFVAPSCSLLHTPVDLDNETKLDAELKQWLAFAKQKLSEVAILAKAANQGEDAVAAELDANRKAHAARSASPRIHKQDVKQRLAAVTDNMKKRMSSYGDRREKQQQTITLPLFPTTTIGSFPQTADVRKARADFKAGRISAADYEAFLEKETISCIRYQEEADIDVLVHGEFERNDMVEYFGEQLGGFTFTENGWVQSYGSRCVKPPVIFGDVYRENPMTIRWINFAQAQTKRIMKGMLTGPVTILQWSFVRDDQPRSETCYQIGLAIRDEVVDLEKAGIKIIQIDEAALREGLPLRRSNWKTYLDWAVDSFRLTASGVKDETQIHTHMCYSEFNDIIEAVANMDADVISIETSRSQMELLDAFVNFKYPNEIGPGVYDIHSPRVPTQEEMEQLLRKALEVLTPAQLWVNPDCGLKTRGWKEVKPALEGMVHAAKKLRQELANKAAA